MGMGENVVFEKSKNKNTRTLPVIDLENITVIVLNPAAESVLTKIPDAPQHAPAASGIKTANRFMIIESFASIISIYDKRLYHCSEAL